MNDILNKKDIVVFVDSFYEKVKKDDLLGSIFAAKIPDGNWQPHLEKMYRFWHTVLFSEPEYRGVCNNLSHHLKILLFYPDPKGRKAGFSNDAPSDSL